MQPTETEFLITSFSYFAFTVFYTLDVTWCYSVVYQTSLADLITRMPSTWWWSHLYPMQSFQFQYLFIRFSKKNSLNNIGSFSCLLYSYSKTVRVTKLTSSRITWSVVKHKVQHFTMKSQHKVMELSKLGSSMKHFINSWIYKALLMAWNDGLKYITVQKYF